MDAKGKQNQYQSIFKKEGEELGEELQENVQDKIKLVKIEELGDSNLSPAADEVGEKILNDLKDIVSMGNVAKQQNNQAENIPALSESALKEIIASSNETEAPELQTETTPVQEETYQSRKYPDLSENAIKVLERRYLKKDADGNLIETPNEMFWRVAENIAKGDLNYDSNVKIDKTSHEFYEIMRSMEFMPNSPTLMNAGRPLQQLSACFVLPVEDSMEQIFETIKDTAIIHKSGGGTGFSFSKLRPSNSPVASTSGVSSGPISFMKVFDSATEAIKQGGTRRGANMGILRIDHPDIEDFIKCKDEDGKINNFNISVGMTAEFMKAYESGSSYNLVDPHTKQVTGQLNATEVFDKVVYQAWKNGEPGIIFLDRMNAQNPTPHIGTLESTNPCGEQPLLPYESCNLGSINLSRFVKEGRLDYYRLAKVVHSSTHFLDNVIEMNKYPILKIEMLTKSNRKIGLGLMGFHDMLIKMGISYNSDQAVELAEDVMRFIRKESEVASCKLAKIRGVFPNFNGSVFDTPSGPRVRNATLTTIAPTGTISIIANSSSGIEPIFAVSYIRNVMDNDKLIETNALFEEIAKDRGIYSKELLEKIAETGNLADMDEIPQDIKDLFVTSHEVTPQQHIKIQAAFQKYTDNAVSKTVNFGHSATEDDIRTVYTEAYRQGCKGVTIYRDGSREGQVLSTGSTGKTEEVEKETVAPATPVDHGVVTRPRPRVTIGKTQRFNTGCGNLYVTINECGEGKPFELFTQMGKSGGCASSQSEAISRLASMALRSNIEPAKIVKQLGGISCHQPAWDSGMQILSCADGIAKALQFYIKGKKNLEENGITSSAPLQEMKMTNKEYKQEFAENSVYASLSACPECASHSLEHVNGCDLCLSCGYSHC